MWRTFKLVLFQMTFSERYDLMHLVMLENLNLLAMSHFLTANRIIDSLDNITLNERTILESNHIILLNIYFVYILDTYMTEIASPPLTK
jgi:hypothetical protein